MSDNHFQYRSYQNQIENDFDGRKTFYMNHQFVRVTSLDLANTNIQYKQINYDADNIDNNK